MTRTHTLRTHKLWCTAVAVALLVVLGACTSEKATADPGFAGHWTSVSWGEHYIRVDGDKVKVIYDHLDGRAVGTLRDKTFTGWWTESPSRQPSAQAGEVEFTMTGTNDARTIDGRWWHGTAGAVREDWDLVWVDANIPADIAAKFDDDAMFIPHP